MKGQTEILSVEREITPSIAFLESIDLKHYDLLFFDSEFSHLPNCQPLDSWIYEVEVISFALVPWADPDNFFSVERKKENLPLASCSSFVKEQVIPMMRPQDTDHFFADGNASAGPALVSFLRERQRKTGKEPVIILDWAGEFFILNQLLARAPSFPLKTMLIANHPALQLYFYSQEFFNHFGLVRHNALDDARAMRWSFLTYRESFSRNPFTEDFDVSVSD